MKVLVYLGAYKTFYHDQWIVDWNNGKANDSAPYGYNRCESEGLQINYMRSSLLEKKIFIRPTIFYKIYVKYIKLPIELLKYDCIWTHIDRDALLVAKFKSLPFYPYKRIKLVSNFIWLPDQALNTFNIRKIEKIKLKLRYVDEIIILAPTEKEVFVEKFDQKNDKLHYIPFRINNNAYTNAIQKKPDDFHMERYILTVGNDRDRDIEAIKTIATSINIDIVFVTSNSSFKNTDYPSNVYVISADFNEMNFLYCHCEFVFIPVKYNEHVSGCTTILESYAHKKPIITNRVPSITAYVIENETGIIVNDLKGFVKEINELLGDEKRQVDMGKHAYDFLMKHGDTKDFAKAHRDITIKLLGKS